MIAPQVAVDPRIAERIMRKSAHMGREKRGRKDSKSVDGKRPWYQNAWIWGPAGVVATVFAACFGAYLNHRFHVQSTNEEKAADQMNKCSIVFEEHPLSKKPLRVVVQNTSDIPLRNAQLVYGFIVLRGKQSEFLEFRKVLSSLRKEEPLVWEQPWPPRSERNHVVVFGVFLMDDGSKPFGHQSDLLPYNAVNRWKLEADLSNVAWKEDPEGRNGERDFIREKLNPMGFNFGPDHASLFRLAPESTSSTIATPSGVSSPTIRENRLLGR